MPFDTHNHALSALGDVPKRGVYDSTKNGGRQGWELRKQERLERRSAL